MGDLNWNTDGEVVGFTGECIWVGVVGIDKAGILLRSSGKSMSKWSYSSISLSETPGVTQGCRAGLYFFTEVEKVVTGVATGL